MPSLETLIDRRLRLLNPRYVDSFEFMLDEDSTGDLAVFVWVIIEDTAPEGAWSATSRNRIRRQVRDAIDAVTDMRVYIYFQSVSEQEELDD